AGELIGAVNMLVDITERKVADDHRQLLLNELNHRVKNTLATVQSIAAQSFRRDASNQSCQWFEGRLIALSKAHDVLSRENWQAADLRDVIEQAVAPFRVDGQQRFVSEGPAQRLRPKQALALAMALHELCTNAAKYGALSSDSGQVRIAWEVSLSEQTPTLHLHWEEVGGPVVTPPVRKGFGSRLLERGLGGELDAEVRLAYLAGGVVCDIEVPLQ
ncbi:MAG TPA: histidine kinase, partial [Pseudomonas sp.]|nr:histidine kinase [Pseudomonas sp.]